MLSTLLEKYLNDNKVDYKVIQHGVAFTAQETAASAHIHGIEMAKTVIVKLDHIFAMAVLPSNEYVDLDAFADAFDVRNVELAGEEEFQRFFPGCEPGAMPPFGNLFGMKVYVACDLAKLDTICFNAGSHTELVQMRFEDYRRLAGPIILQFAHLV